MGQTVVKALVERFGQNKVRVCTAFHVQVLTDKGPHNIWMGDTLKLQLAGTRGAQNCGGLAKLLDRIANHKHEQTPYHEMTEAHRLTQFIGHAVAQKKDGIWVDAGWKEGKARLSLVCVLGENITAKSWTLQCRDAFEAECQALITGLRFEGEFGLIRVPVYSDCKNAVEASSDPRAQWIPREQNKVADRIGNMRNG